MRLYTVALPGVDQQKKSRQRRRKRMSSNGVKRFTLTFPRLAPIVGSSATDIRESA
jgi:hypothetical protein